ncbi:MAG: sulfatase-like hydrolase/transferase [Verrucomicrobiales bacterium]
MNCRHLAAQALTVLTLAASGFATAPNFLVLIADDMRADAIHAHGHPTIRTPNLDKVAADGFSFREAHCYGSNSGAVCVPSRAIFTSIRCARRSSCAAPACQPARSHTR